MTTPGADPAAARKQADAFAADAVEQANALADAFTALQARRAARVRRRADLLATRLGKDDPVAADAARAARDARPPPATPRLPFETRAPPARPSAARKPREGAARKRKR